MNKKHDIVNFMTPLPLIGAWFPQTKYTVMITKEGSTKIVNLMTPGCVIF